MGRTVRYAHKSYHVQVKNEWFHLKKTYTDFDDEPYHVQ